MVFQIGAKVVITTVPRAQDAKIVQAMLRSDLLTQKWRVEYRIKEQIYTQAFEESELLLR